MVAFILTSNERGKFLAQPIETYREQKQMNILNALQDPTVSTFAAAIAFGAASLLTGGTITAVAGAMLAGGGIGNFINSFKGA